MQVGLCFQTYFEFNFKERYGFTQRDVTCQHILKDELLQFRINFSVYSFNVSSVPPIQCVSHYSFQIANMFYWCIQIFSFWIHTCLEIDKFFRVLPMVLTSCVISFSDAQ
jgi:hypothetical protein